MDKGETLKLLGLGLALVVLVADQQVRPAVCLFAPGTLAKDRGLVAPLPALVHPGGMCFVDACGFCSYRSTDPQQAGTGSHHPARRQWAHACCYCRVRTGSRWIRARLICGPRLADALPHDEHVSFELSGNDVDSFFGLHASSEGLRASFTQIKAEWSGVQSRPVGTGEPGVIEDPAMAAR